MALDVKSLTGEEISTVLPALARLRMVVFRDWPYLYDGTLEYEETYLAKLAAAPGAVCVIARDGDEIVGASTAAPMIEHADEFAEPFEKAGFDLDKIFYCGESVLLKSHRGPWPRPRLLRRARGARQTARRLHAFDLLPRRAPRRSSAEAGRLRAARRLLEEARLRPGRRPRRHLRLEGHRPGRGDRSRHAVLDEAAHRHHIGAHEPPPDPQGRLRAVPDRPAGHARRVAGQDRALGRRRRGDGRRGARLPRVRRDRAGGGARRAGLRQSRCNAAGGGRSRAPTASAFTRSSPPKHRVHILVGSGPVAQRRRPLRQRGPARHAQGQRRRAGKAAS